MKTNPFRFSVYKSGIGVILSRICGLFRDISIASFFGATKITDIFFIAFAIPNLFRALFAEGALASAFVPIFSDKLARNRYSALKYLSSLISIIFIITVIIVFIFIIFSKYIIIFFMPGYYEQQEVLKTGSMLLKILMPYLPIITICGLLSG
ncbi:MAG: lipid II flippase MurJ, partial [Deferribacterota bacterium]|nr:lipid II flippase MurJ [Deferribacterota bacterium]